VFWNSREATDYQGIELPGNRNPPAQQALSQSLHLEGPELEEVFGSKGIFSGQALEENLRGGVEVAGGIGSLAGELFRGHVGDGSDHVPFCREGMGSKLFAESEIGQDASPLWGEQDVVWLQVSM
jgi:hypothetical protein